MNEELFRCAHTAIRPSTCWLLVSPAYASMAPGSKSECSYLSTKNISYKSESRKKDLQQTNRTVFACIHILLYSLFPHFCVRMCTFVCTGISRISLACILVYLLLDFLWFCVCFLFLFFAFKNANHLLGQRILRWE